MHAPGGVVRKRPLVVTLLAIVDLLGGLLRLLLGCLFAAMIADPQARVLGVVLSALLLVPGVLQLAAAVGMLKLRPWGRVLQIVVAILSLLNFPLGTVVGTMTLIYIFQPAVKTLFSERPVESLSDEERGHLVQVGTLGNVAAVVIACVLGVGGLFYLGIVAAIAIPNLLNAIDRGKQKRTMADLRSIGTAVEEYALENSFYPEAEDLAALERALVPKHMKSMPRMDGWRQPFSAASTREHYRLESFGKGGADEPDQDGEQPAFEADIVLVDGEFTQWPARPSPR